MNSSIYLHCDPTASHYLKMFMDAVFEPTYFKNEIIWKRTGAHGNVTGTYGDVTDTILFYGKSDRTLWNQQFVPLRDKLIASKFRYSDTDGRRWQSVTLRNPGVRPNLKYPYTASNGMTYQPHPNGWSCDIERMQHYDREDRLYYPSKPAGQLRLKMYLDESKGGRVQNLWDDISPINSQAVERLGYPTQKPEALLERIILASSHEGDIVLDPFCGCGTAISTSQRLKRQWIVIDITHLAIGLIKSRLRDAYGDHIKETYTVTGEPTDLSSAKSLAQQDPFQFQWWALGLVGSRQAAQKKGADKGIDGQLFFHDRHGGTTQKIILSVKSGHLKPDDVRSLLGVVNREQAAIGVLITLHPPTRPMKADAASAGFYEAVEWNRQLFPRIQILTIADLLEGKEINYPKALNVTFKVAPKRKYVEPENQPLAL